MTTFTSEDRDAAYRQKVEEAPYHPGYEDAVITRCSDPVYKGMDPTKMLWKSKHLDLEQIVSCAGKAYGFKDLTKEDIDFVRVIEKEHGII